LDDQIKEDEFSRACKIHGSNKKYIQKPEGRRKLVTPRHRWQENNTVNVTVLMFLS
jgi:hypothetical protein